jgi:hypothetical protein
MEDAESKNTKLSLNSLIQETGQEQRPARMVGHFSLDSAKSSKEAGCIIGLDFYGRGGKDDKANQ